MTMEKKELTHRDFIKLSDRLMMSAGMVTKGGRVADIGCDHAHTDIWLVKEDIAVSAIAMDVGEGPLSHARANVDLYGLNDRIEMRLSDGLQALKPGEVDTIIIAGMGGTLTTLILQAGYKAAFSAKELILQPQSDVWMVRRFLRHHAFRIVDEKMCIEDGKFYVSMKAVPVRENAGRKSEEPEAVSECTALRDWTEAMDILVSDEYGKILISQKNPVLIALLDNQLKKNTRILEQIGVPENQDGIEKKEFFQKERDMLMYTQRLMSE